MNVSPPKILNTDQLLGELQAQGFPHGINTRSVAGTDSSVLASGPQPVEEVTTDDALSAAEETTLANAVTAHVAMRPKTDAEYSAEFQASDTTAARKQEIRDIMNGLLPPEMVPMT